MHVIPRQLRPVVRRLHTDADFRKRFDRRRAQLRIKRHRVLFEITQHALVDDVDIGKDARLLPIDHRGFEMAEMPAASGAGIHHRRHTRAKTVRVSDDAQAFRAALRCTCVIYVHMDVDDARRNVAALYIHHTCGISRVQVRTHSHDFFSTDGHVTLAVDIVLRVDHMTALQQEIVLHARKCTRK